MNLHTHTRANIFTSSERFNAGIVHRTSYYFCIPVTAHRWSHLWMRACRKVFLHNMPNMCAQWSAQTFHKYFTIHPLHARMMNICLRSIHTRKHPPCRCDAMTMWIRTDVQRRLLCLAMRLKREDMQRCASELAKFILCVEVMFVCHSHYILIGRLTSATQKQKWIMFFDGVNDSCLPLTWRHTKMVCEVDSEKRNEIWWAIKRYKK